MSTALRYLVAGEFSYYWYPFLRSASQTPFLDYTARSSTRLCSGEKRRSRCVASPAAVTDHVHNTVRWT